jgi:hypothetical protein
MRATAGQGRRRGNRVNGLIDAVVQIVGLLLVYRVWVWFAMQEEARRALGCARRRWWWLRALPGIVLIGLVWSAVAWWRDAGGHWVNSPATIAEWRAEQERVIRFEGAAGVAAAILALGYVSRQRQAIERELRWRSGGQWWPRWWMVSAGAIAAGVAVWWFSS